MADRPIMSDEISKICADFTRLWSTGGKAKLSVECSDCRACALLEIYLGTLGPGTVQVARRRPPSYWKRQPKCRQLFKSQNKSEAVAGDVSTRERSVDLVVDQPTRDFVNVNSSSGAVSTGERCVDSVLDQPTLNCANIDSRFATSASSFEEAENVSENVIETRKITA